LWSYPHGWQAVGSSRWTNQEEEEEEVDCIDRKLILKTGEQNVQFHVQDGTG
jgi:hypothetical protein